MINKEDATREELLKEHPNEYKLVPIGTLEWLAGDVDNNEFWLLLATKMHEDDIDFLIKQLNQAKQDLAADVEQGHIHTRLAKKKRANIDYVIDMMEDNK